MVSFERARSIILKSVSRRVVVKMGLDVASMRVLAKDVFARVDSPEFDKSLMDGFAVRSQDVQAQFTLLKCIDTVKAGSPPVKRLNPGECSKIFTGAMLPQGADSVVMKEYTEISRQGKIKFLKCAKSGGHIARRGRDLKKKDILIQKGSVLNSSKVSLLASQGIRHVSVYKPPDVAILSTGDEIVEPGEKKKISQIWNASGSMLVSILRRWNLTPRCLGIVKDDLGQMIFKIKSGLKSDILIITGAVSVGDFDLVPVVLKKLGVDIKFHNVSIRPGKPLLFAVKGDCFIFGLPGNPASSIASFMFFVAPLISSLLGHKDGVLLEKGFLSKGVYNESDRKSLFPGTLACKDGRCLITPAIYNGSADLAAVSGADVFFMVGRKKSMGRGAEVNFLRIY